MAPFLFTRTIIEDERIKVFNHVNVQWDFTYIDDAVEAVLRVADKPAQASSGFDTTHPDPATSSAPYRVFNIGNSQPVNMTDYIAALETAVGRAAIKDSLPMQPGDVQATAAGIETLDAWVGFKPNTSVNEGTRRFVDWYTDHYAIS
jgi:UDP-glucuronate 4-epimerase